MNVTPAGLGHVTSCDVDTGPLLQCTVLVSASYVLILVHPAWLRSNLLPREPTGSLLKEDHCCAVQSPLHRKLIVLTLIMTVKHFSVDYQKVNERGAFSPGDILSGKVMVVTSKKIKAQCLLVKAKGKAQVGWCEQDGEATGGYSDKKKYFDLEHIILQDKNKGDGLCCLSLITKSKARLYDSMFI